MVLLLGIFTLIVLLLSPIPSVCLKMSTKKLKIQRLLKVFISRSSVEVAKAQWVLESDLHYIFLFYCSKYSVTPALLLISSISDPNLFLTFLVFNGFL